MALRVCSTPGCPILVPAGAGRCIPCERKHNQARGTSTERGYGTKHQHKRIGWQRRLDKGERVTCWRPDCDTIINPDDWTLGHCDNDRTIYHGPECAPCQYATAGRRDTPCPHPSHPVDN